MNGQSLYGTDDIQKIVDAAVTAAMREANKPKPKTEAELAEIAQAQQLRKETAENDKQR